MTSQKHRQYSIVIHNVDPEKAQAIVEKYVQDAKEYVMSFEPNPKGNGHHFHLFIQFKNQRSFRAVLRELQKLSARIISPRPEGETRDWGRVQLDVMRGTFQDCVAYLQGETKDKPTGEVQQGRHELQSVPDECSLRHGNEGRMYDPDCPGCQEKDRLNEWLCQLIKKNLS